MNKQFYYQYGVEPRSAKHDYQCKGCDVKINKGDSFIYIDFNNEFCLECFITYYRIKQFNRKKSVSE